MTKIRLIFFIITLFGFENTLYAQVQIKDSTDAYQYWAQRGIIEMVYAYMQDYQEIGNQNKKLSQGEKKGIEGYKKQFITFRDSDDSLYFDRKFDSVSLFLKRNDWKDCENNIYQPLKKQFKNYLQLNEDFFLNCKRKNKYGNDIAIDFIPDTKGKDANSRKYWNRRIETIIYEYKKVLNSLNSVVGIEQTEKEVSQLENNLPTKEITDNTDNFQSRTNSDFSFIQHRMEYLYTISFILIGLIIGFFVGRIHVLRKAKKEIYSALNNRTNIEQLGYSFSKDVYRLKQENNNNNNIKKMKLSYNLLEREYNKAKEEIKDLRKDILNKMDEINNLKKILSQNIPDYNLSEQKDTNTEERGSSNFSNKEVSSKRVVRTRENTKVYSPTGNVKKIYFSMPESNGSFQIANGKPSNDGKKYFRIEFEESSNQGTLFFLSSERDQRAINRLESYLKPVCDIENISNSTAATQIELIQSGKVSLINDNWVIDSDNKVKIKLH